MPLFRYSALNEAGKKITGVIDSDSLNSAKEQLKKQQLLLIDVTSLALERREISLDGKLLLTFTRELAQLLAAGLPLYESLLTIEEKYRRHKTHPLFLDLCDHLKGGKMLSVALKKYPKTFNGMYLALVRTGEAGGNLSHILEQLALLLTREQHLKKQILSALLYPSFLALFCLFVTLSFLFFVIPSMRELFEGRALHPLSAFVLNTSALLNEHAGIFFFSLVTVPLSLYFFFRSGRGKKCWERLALRLPLLKTLTLQAAIVRFCRSCSSLLAGGVPLLEALPMAKMTARHSLFQEVIGRAEQKIKEGEKLSMELRAAPFIPPLLSRMFAIAEETGKMGQMMNDAALIYDQDLERNLGQLTAFLQPALLLLLGAVVGLVLLSILIPLTDVSSIFGGN